jgi:nucleoside-diphosphate-sugar epimerase
MRVFVTGGSGFLGARMIPRLVSDGHEVFALVRSASSDEKLRTMGATPVRGDLERPEKLSLPRSMPSSMRQPISASRVRAHPIFAPMSSARPRF